MGSASYPETGEHLSRKKAGIHFRGSVDPLRDPSAPDALRRRPSKNIDPASIGERHHSHALDSGVDSRLDNACVRSGREDGACSVITAGTNCPAGGTTGLESVSAHRTSPD